MSKDSSVKASFDSYGEYNMYRDGPSYGDYFDLDFTINQNNSVTVSGTMGSKANHNLTTPSFTWSVFDFFNPDYAILPVVVRQNNTNNDYLFFKVPRNSTYYAYNGNQKQDGSYTLCFYCSEPFDLHIQNRWLVYQHYNAGSTVTFPDYSSYLFGCNNYTDSTLSDLIYPESVVIPDAQFENYEDTTTYGNTLINGEFTYFYFKVPKTGEQPTPAWVYFHDTTDHDPISFDYVNGSTSVYIDLLERTYIDTQQSYFYDYAYYNDSTYQYYAVPCVLPFGSYNNNSSYSLTLMWTDDDGATVKQKDFDWTTSFSAAGIDKQKENQDNLMLNNLNAINDYINNKGYNTGAIIGNMPNSSGYNSPTDSGINSIFTALYNAFTSTETQSVRFYFPYSNDSYIDIPSDLVTSKLPSSILFIIQTVYWFVICRFIIKDIAGIAQKAKSGEILDGSSDNIKTDLL